jgi:hypothetical protein
MVYWKGKRYQIKETNIRYRLGKKKVRLILEQQNGNIEFMYQGRLLNFVDFDEQLSPLKLVADESILLNNWKNPQGGGHPNPDHPWKQWASHSRKAM